MKRLRRFAAIVLSIVLAFSFAVPGASAQGNASFSQEKAIEKIKGMFDTSGYDVFSINYNEDNDRKIWNLNWSDSKEPYGSLNASVDADTGAILNLNFYKGYDASQKPTLIPKVSEEEARKIAEDFAKKHQPDEFSKTIYRTQQGPIYRPLANRYQQDYSFNFVRVVKDIPVEGDGFYINVSAGTGEVESYSFTWSCEELPSSENIISMEEAEKIFQEKSGLKLVYKRYFNYNTKQDNVKLVYTIDSPYSVLIDAKSGEFLNDANYGPYTRGMGSGDYSMKSDAKQELTPQEQKEVEATKNCITKEAAVKVVQKFLSIPEGYEQNYANLYEDYDNPGEKVWNIGWNKKSKNPGEYGSINARVNAISSELLGFNIWDDSLSNSDFSQKYDRSAAQKIAEDFLKKLQPEKAGNVKLEEISDGNYPEKIREHYFNFTRMVGDIPYPDNGFYISVDSVTGKITNYNMRWQDREFPKADGVLSKQDAEAGFLKDVGLELSYARVYRMQEQENRFYLVYKLKPSISYTFDALDLKPLDYQGNPIEKQAETAFTDIKGHWAEKDIQLLVDMGVIQSAKDRFRPDEDISQGDFIKLLLTATGLGPANNNIVLKTGAQSGEDSESLQDYIDAAIKAGIVKQGEIDAQKSLPREKMAAFLVRALGFEKVASISGIYTVPAKDAAAIAPAYKGHAAIAMGLSLITGIDGRFEPRGSVTRAQAAVVLVRMLKVQAEK
ncbi:MAG: S-layer homology domain-containing protein [Tepidanaerobacteraceae bacterium]|nr:S-layer homology domain-containing protein [Tepidanaerobacteraceae bacterium]